METFPRLLLSPFPSIAPIPPPRGLQGTNGTCPALGTPGDSRDTAGDRGEFGGTGGIWDLGDGGIWGGQGGFGAAASREDEPPFPGTIPAGKWEAAAPCFPCFYPKTSLHFPARLPALHCPKSRCSAPKSGRGGAAASPGSGGRSAPWPRVGVFGSLFQPRIASNSSAFPFSPGISPGKTGRERGGPAGKLRHGGVTAGQSWWLNLSPPCPLRPSRSRAALMGWNGNENGAAFMGFLLFSIFIFQRFFPVLLWPPRVERIPFPSCFRGTPPAAAEPPKSCPGAPKPLPWIWGAPTGPWRRQERGHRPTAPQIAAFSPHHDPFAEG